MEFITQFSETPQRVRENMVKENIVPVQSTFNEFCTLFLKSLRHSAFPEEYPPVHNIENKWSLLHSSVKHLKG